MLIIARAQYDERPVLASDLSFEGDPGVTKQSDSKDCDINSLFAKFERSGTLPDMILKNGRYGDFSNALDYQSALNVVLLAKEQFDNLDAPIRNKFDNDPYKFLEFCNDPKNIDELEKWKLLKPEVIEARKAARAAKDAADEASSKVARDAEYKALVERIKADLAK